jgi:hypothetical protein
MSDDQLEAARAAVSSLDILDSLAGQAGRLLEGLPLSVGGARDLPQTM